MARKLESEEFALVCKLQKAEQILSEINETHFDLLRSFVGYDHAIRVPLSQTQIGLARYDLETKLGLKS